MKSYLEKVDMPDKNFKVKSFLSLDVGQSITVHPHWHEEVEVLLVLDGVARQQVEGEYIDIKTGDIVIISKNQLHSTYSYEGSSCSILVLMFDSRNVIDNTYIQFSGDKVNVFENYIKYYNPINMLKDSCYHELKGCIEKINLEMKKKNVGYEMYIRALLYNFAGCLARYKEFYVVHQDLSSLKVTRQMLEKTFRLIDENFHDEISLNQAATAANISVPHFCRLFKKATGMTFKEYLTFFRVNKAEKLLTTDKTILTISLECGFGSVSSMARGFKKYKNTVPSYYKKNK